MFGLFLEFYKNYSFSPPHPKKKKKLKLINTMSNKNK